MKRTHPISSNFNTLKRKLRVQTKRLEVRFVEEADYGALVAAQALRKPRQNEFDEDPLTRRQMSKSEFSKMLRRRRSGALLDRTYAFEIFDRHSGEHIGGIDFYIFVRGAFQWANVGYAVHNHHWRKGYAKEALRGALGLAFDKLGLLRVEAATELRNRASRKVALSSGMKKEGIRRRFMQTSHGTFEDMVIYFLHLEDFKKRTVRPV